MGAFILVFGLAGLFGCVLGVFYVLLNGLVFPSLTLTRFRFPFTIIIIIIIFPVVFVFVFTFTIPVFPWWGLFFGRRFRREPGLRTGYASNPFPWRGGACAEPLRSVPGPGGACGSGLARSSTRPARG